ncbi:MAG: hypothetical protein OXI30_04135 [Chloroflexota bacterium]|nr:hypothetical protein [Chloroflexota bacterium]
MEEHNEFGCFTCLVLIIIGALAFGLLNRLLRPVFGTLSDWFSSAGLALSGVRSTLEPLLPDSASELGFIVASVFIEMCIGIIVLLPLCLIGGLVFKIGKWIWKPLIEPLLWLVHDVISFLFFRRD